MLKAGMHKINGDKAQMLYRHSSELWWLDADYSSKGRSLAGRFLLLRGMCCLCTNSLQTKCLKAISLFAFFCKSKNLSFLSVSKSFLKAKCNTNFQKVGDACLWKLKAENYQKLTRDMKSPIKAGCTQRKPHLGMS